MSGFWARLWRDARGMMALEIGLALPVVVVLALVGVEVTRYVLLGQKVERASATMGDLVARAETLSAADLDTLFLAAGLTVAPFDLAGRGRVVVSQIGAAGGTPARVNWQRGYGAGGGASAFGTAGAAAVLPAGFVVRDGESVVTAEVFYDFEPTFAPDEVAAGRLYRFAILRPRFGALDSLE